jgi:hypothetical protein
MKRYVGVVAMVLLAGCEPAASPPPPENDSSRALERAVQEPLDKARAVEDQIKAEKLRQDREIEEGGG